MIWYAESPKTGGGWQPELHHQDQKPGPRAGLPDLAFRVDPVEVPEWMWRIDPKITIKEIHMCLSPSGEFFGYPDEVHQAIIKYRRDGE